MAVEQALVTASPQASSVIPSSSSSFDPVLENLNQLLHSRAEVFASPSATSSSSSVADGGQSIHEQTLKATKYLFDSCTFFDSPLKLWLLPCKYVLKHS